ncbi:FAD-dependent monooxygenase [Methylobacterium persicinum]|uniref:2-polyprenyl-6-methoxyphenol hydroxylase-like FAD-dependent oxidoreductase n=1 Tax=Methylobacterium persicinum TaxID=374426 RepID=A0ABU0HJZ4_9HYPH|nr:2-polyprenyl-6-methoxyphenol hydroxylase-like FAD-dependent oxidoreductase [Methylobacterium persicinum]
MINDEAGEYEARRPEAGAHAAAPFWISATSTLPASARVSQSQSCTPKHNYHRLFFLADDTGVPDRDPTLDEMQAFAREVTGDETLTLTDPKWLTQSRFQYGVSPGYAQGRVFLAGDAGHLSLPIGGQGMNAGLHDAVEIAWRLAMTLRGEAAPVILDSYDGERGGEHARLSAQQARGFRWTVYRSPVTDTVLGLAAKALPNLGSLLQGTDDMQQIGVEYPKSLLNRLPQ